MAGFGCPPRPVLLQSFRDSASSEQIVIDALRALKGGAEPAPELVQRALFMANDAGEPLVLLMAAIAVSHAPNLGIAIKSRGQLARFLARRELNRIREIAKDHNADAILAYLLAASLTLSNGGPAEAIGQFIDSESAALTASTTASVVPLRDTLVTALETLNGRVNGISPSLVGEAFVLETLKDGRLSADARGRLLLRSAGRAPLETLRVLVQTATDFEEEGKPAVDWLEFMIGRVAEDAAAMSLVNDILPADTFMLRHVAVIAAKHLVSNIRSGRARDILLGEPEKEALARALINLANRQSAVRDKEGAKQSALEAVSLVATSGDAELKARCYSTLGNRLGEAGEPADALVAATTALSLRRAAAANHAPGQLSLARSLVNAAACHLALGQNADAITRVREGIELLRALSRSGQPEAIIQYARALTNLSSALRRSGPKFEVEAVDVARVAVSVRRQLSDIEPDAYRANLIISLIVYAQALIHRATVQPADITVAKQALLEAHAALTARGVDAVPPGTLSEDPLGVCLSELTFLATREHNLNEINKYQAQLVQHLRPSLEEMPPSEVRRFATLASYLGEGLAFAGKNGEAVVAFNDGIAAYSRLAPASDDDYEGLSRAFNGLVVSLLALHQSVEARRAVDQQFEAAESCSSVVGSITLKVRAFVSLARIELGDRNIAEMQQANRQALQLYSGTVAPTDSLSKAIADSLIQEASALVSVGLPEPARLAAEHAKDIATASEARGSQNLRDVLGRALETLGNLNPTPAGLQQLRAARDIFAELRRHEPGKWALPLAGCESNIAITLAGLGDVSGALKHGETALRILCDNNGARDERLDLLTIVSLNYSSFADAAQYKIDPALVAGVLSAASTLVAQGGASSAEALIRTLFTKVAD
jgi:tetratricopeptide (TPR) repeat protein